MRLSRGPPKKVESSRLERGRRSLARLASLYAGWRVVHSARLSAHSLVNSAGLACCDCVVDLVAGALSWRPPLRVDPIDTRCDPLNSCRTRSSTPSRLEEGDSHRQLAPTPRPRRLRRPRTASSTRPLLASPSPPHPVDRLRLRLGSGRVHRVGTTSIRSRTVKHPTSSSSSRGVTLPRVTLLHRPARPLPLPAVRSHRRPTRAPRLTTVTRVPKSCRQQVLFLPKERTTSHRRRRQERPPSASRSTTRRPWASTRKNRHSKRVKLRTSPRSQVCRSA